MNKTDIKKEWITKEEDIKTEWQQSETKHMEETMNMTEWERHKQILETRMRGEENVNDNTNWNKECILIHTTAKT